MQVSKKKVEDAYQKNAAFYDLAVKVLYPLIGLKISTYRKNAVEYLNLEQGDCVVDLGCGTGLAFPLIMEKIGPDGKLIGVDISSAMLSVAKDRVNSAGWKNVELIHSDIEEYHIPAGLNGVITIGVFGYLNEREKVLENIYKSLVDHARVVIVDGKRPQKWPSFLFKLFVKLSSPYGLTESYFDNNTLNLVYRLFQSVTFEDMYGGLLYIVSGEKLEKLAQQVNQADARRGHLFQSWAYNRDDMNPSYTREIIVSSTPAEAYKALTTGFNGWWTTDCNPITDTGDNITFKFGSSYWVMRASKLIPDKLVELECIEAHHVHDGLPSCILNEWNGSKLQWCTRTVFTRHPGSGLDPRRRL